MKKTLTIMLSVVAILAILTGCESAAANGDDTGDNRGNGDNGGAEEVTGGQVVDGALIVRGRLSEIDFPDGYVVPTEPIFNLRIDKPTSNDPDDDNVAVNDDDGGDDFRMEYSETPPDLQDIVDWLNEPELAISNTNAKATDAMVQLYDQPNDDLLSIDYITIDPEDDTVYYQVYVYVSEATSITGTLTAEDGVVETFDLSLVAGWNVVIASENGTSNTSTIGTTVPDGLEGVWFAEID